MPELPEVEVVRAGLDRHVVGATVTQVEVLHPRPVRRHPTGPTGFVAEVRGRTITAARRRGKYLWLPLDDGNAILAHLGMSGQLLVQSPGAPPERHLRVRFGLAFEGEPGLDTTSPSGSAYSTSDRLGGREASASDRLGGRVSSASDRLGGRVASASDRLGGRVASASERIETPRPLELRFVDQRMFGGLAVSAGGAELPPEIVHIARDPIDPEFDADAFVRRVRRSSSGIKRLLLDQTVISGVGNIYADEALWRSRLHGERPGNRLTGPVLRELLGHVRDVMGDALAQGGTSFDALYVNVNGESGYFDRSLNAYGREDEPCRRCGTPMRRAAFMNRSSYFCPVCQPPPRRATSRARTDTPGD